MDSVDGATLTSLRGTLLEGATSPRSDPVPIDLVSSSHGAHPTADCRDAMDADEEIPPKSRQFPLEDDLLPEAKRPRVRHVTIESIVKRRGRICRNTTASWYKYRNMSVEEIDAAMNQIEIDKDESEEKRYGRLLGKYFREITMRRKKLNMQIKKEGGKVLSERPLAIARSSDVGNIDCWSELQEQFKLPGLASSSEEKVSYWMSNEWMDKSIKQTKLALCLKNKKFHKEIIENGFKHMNEEALTAFRNHLAEKGDFEGFDHKFGEVLDHCLSVGKRDNIYCHYNFTVEMKKNDEECWTSRLYFAEAKLVHGVKYYFCSPLETTDDGYCYLCTEQLKNELKHPAGGGYEKGHDGNCFHYMDDYSGDEYELD